MGPDADRGDDRPHDERDRLRARPGGSLSGRVTDEAAVKSCGRLLVVLDPMMGQYVDFPRPTASHYVTSTGSDGLIT